MLGRCRTGRRDRQGTTAGSAVSARLDTAVGYARDEVRLEVITYERIRAGSYDVSARLADTDVTYVRSALCFPTFPRFCGQPFAEAADKEQPALLCVRADQGPAQVLVGPPVADRPVVPPGCP